MPADAVPLETIRRAATVVVARDTADDLEVLVVERSAATRFLPRYVAFPGGAVDELDAELATAWFQDASQAVRAAAVRELLEEVGLALTSTGLLDGGPTLGAVDVAPPSPDQLVEIARWVAPEDVPVRFDARYYAVRTDRDVAPTPDDTETAAAWWVSPRRLLEEWEAGARRLYWPTWLTVRALADCQKVADLMALRIDTREPDEDELDHLPPSVFWQDR